METIGDRLLRLITERGTNMRTLAADLGSSPSYVSELCSGKRNARKVAVDKFFHMASLLETTPEYLLEGQGEKMDKAKTSKEAQLLMLFRMVAEDRKDFLLDMLKAAGHSGNESAA